MNYRVQADDRTWKGVCVCARVWMGVGVSDVRVNSLSFVYVCGGVSLCVSKKSLDDNAITFLNEGFRRFVRLARTEITKNV